MEFDPYANPYFVSMTPGVLELLYQAIENNQCTFVVEALHSYVTNHVNWSPNDFKKSGSSPLIHACQHGNLTIAQFLIEKIGIPVSDCATVKFENEVIEDAPPIWVASAAGHIALVKYLLSRGADVNAVTSTNSTSLRAACFDGHYDIVEFLIENGADIEIANQHNHTCLMIACYKKHFEIVKLLVRSGAEVNRRSRKGNTALHDCAEGGSTEIMKFLLDNGALFQKDEYGVSPLMAAAVSAHASVVRFIMDTYVTPIFDESTLSPDDDRGSRISPSEQIDVLEMLGCSMIDKKQDLMEGLTWWKRASQMRSLYYSVGLVAQTKQIAQPVSDLDGISEYQSIEDVEEMMNDFDVDYIKMQSLLVRQRLLGFKHPDTTYYIRYRGAVLADMGDYARCLKLWRYVLRNLVENLDSLCCNILLCAIQSYIELFGFLLHMQTLDNMRANMQQLAEKCFIEIADVVSVLRACVCLYNFHKLWSLTNPLDQFIASQSKTDSTCMKLICKLVVFFVLLSSRKAATSKEGKRQQSTSRTKERYGSGNDLGALKDEVTNLLVSLIKNDIRDQDGNSLLHIILHPDCCGVERHRITKYPYVSAVDFMLRIYKSLYLNIDIENKRYLSPLAGFYKHYEKICSCEELQTILSLFEGHGAHIDFDSETRPDFSPLVIHNDRMLRNNLTVEFEEEERMKVLKMREEKGESTPKNLKPLKPKYPLRCQSLKCLSACAVLEYDCDYSFLCENLKRFILKH